MKVLNIHLEWHTKNTWSLGITMDSNHVGFDLLWRSIVVCF